MIPARQAAVGASRPSADRWTPIEALPVAGRVQSDGFAWPHRDCGNPANVATGGSVIVVPASVGTATPRDNGRGRCGER